MSKFNVTGRPAVAATSPVITDAIATAVTYEGASGYARDAKSELFLLAVSNMVGENTFYEAAGQRDARFAALVRALALTDPDWTARLIGWLRNGVNLRSAALVAAAEFVAARLAAGQPGGNRQVIGSVLVRADEPGELLAYWFAAHGRNVPQPVKRGVADAAARLYRERSLLKWDSAERSVRFADVLELTHAAPVAAWQGQLFRYAIDRRHNRSGAVQSGLPMLAARSELMALPVAHRRAVLDDPDRLAAAGMTWEALAGWLQGPLDAGGLAGGDPVDGLHGPAAEPAEFRPRRGAGPGRGAGGGPAGRPGSGRPVATAADAIPGRLPGGAAAAVGGGAGERAAGIAGRSSVAAGPDAGARRPVRVHVRFGNLGGTNYRRAFRCTRGTSPATGSGTVRRGWACGTPSAA